MSLKPDLLNNKDMSALADHEIEQIFISNQKRNMALRAPGKYDKLRVLSVLSNFNPLSKLFKNIPNSGLGLFPALEISYHFGRAVDDVADGDMPLPIGHHSFQEWMGVLKEIVRTKGESVEKELSVKFMLQRVFARFEKLHSQIDLQAEVNAFLEAMTREYERRVNRLVLSQKELEIINENSFGSPHTITLAALKSKTKAENIYELSQVQGRIQALTDLHVELSKGICNIPLEILSASGLVFSDLEMGPTLINKNSIIQNWIQNECLECNLLLQQLKAKNSTFDPIAKIYVKFLATDMDNCIKKLSSST